MDEPPRIPDLNALVAELGRTGPGVIMVMGKGGVGKTTIAITIARRLAHNGLRTILSTTDPAGRLGELVTEPPSGLTISRIDPTAEVQRYVDERLRSASNFDPERRRAARRGLEFSMHRGTRCLPGVLAPATSRSRPVRGRRHRSHRPHALAARPHRRLPPRCHAGKRHDPGACHHTAHATSRSCVHASTHRHPGRDHAGERSSRAPSGPSTCRNRAFRMGHQREPRGERHTRPRPTAPRHAGASASTKSRRRTRNALLDRPLGSTAVHLMKTAGYRISGWSAAQLSMRA